MFSIVDLKSALGKKRRDGDHAPMTYKDANNLHDLINIQAQWRLPGNVKGLEVE